MKARIKWVENVCFVGESESGHAVVMDGAPEGGGRNLGMRPMETVLIGAGAKILGNIEVGHCARVAAGSVVLSPVPHLDSGINWHTKAESYRASIARMLGATVLPDLENQIATSKITTPLDFQDRLSSFRGAAFGLEPVLWQSAWFRPHNQSEEVKNLFLVGAGTHPGAGLPGVLSSARVLDSLVPPADSLVTS